MLLLKDGVVTGADMVGGLYDGRYNARADDVVFTMTMTVPAGVVLVQGTAPQAKPYTLPFNAVVPNRAIETFEPVLVQLPPGPVNVIFKLLRPMEN